MMTKVNDDLDKLLGRNNEDAYQHKLKVFEEEFATKTSWSSNRINALGSPFDSKSDEIDVESLWQVQPD